MASVARHAANIIALAGKADTLVSQFRQLMADIETEENALHLQATKNGPHVQDAVAGRRRLAHYAHMLAASPGGATVTEIASTAWREFVEI